MPYIHYVYIRFKLPIHLEKTFSGYNTFFKAQLAGVSVFSRLSKPVGTFTLPFILWLVLAFITTNYKLPTKYNCLTNRVIIAFTPSHSEIPPSTKTKEMLSKKISFKVHLCPKIRSVVTRQKGLYFLSPSKVYIKAKRYVQILWIRINHFHLLTVIWHSAQKEWQY